MHMVRFVTCGFVGQPDKLTDDKIQSAAMNKVEIYSSDREDCLGEEIIVL